MKRPIKTLIAVLAIACNTAACAQMSGIELQQERAKRCPDGQYAGEIEGAHRFYKDPHIWFVSREFARRFCMPEVYIDDSLKGALAVAVLLKPSEFRPCELVGGAAQCSASPRLLVDVYIDHRQANIPKADPSVKYYSGVIKNSAWLLGTTEAIAQRRRRGEVTEEVGERRPFSPLGKEAHEGPVQMLYLGARKAWATGSGRFVEEFYRANWVDGIDVISLHGVSFGTQELRNPDQQIQEERRGDRGYVDEDADKTDPIQQWAIGFINGPKYFGEYGGATRSVPYPAGYDHVIVLPRKLAQIIYHYDWKQGESFFGATKSSMRPGSGLPK